MTKKRKYQLDPNAFITYEKIYDDFRFLLEAYMEGRISLGVHRGKVTGLVRKKLSVLKVIFLIELANDLKLDMTITTAERILLKIFQSSTEKKILIEHFSTAGRHADDKSDAYIENLERFEYYVDNNLGLDILKKEKEKLEKMRASLTSETKIMYTKIDTYKAKRKRLDKEFDEILAERERKKEYEKNHELNFDDQPNPALTSG